MLGSNETLQNPNENFPHKLLAIYIFCTMGVVAFFTFMINVHILCCKNKKTTYVNPRNFPNVPYSRINKTKFSNI